MVILQIAGKNDVHVIYFFGILFEKDGFPGNYVSLLEAETKNLLFMALKVRWYTDIC